MKGAYLRLEHISKTFPGVKALKDVSLYANRGEIIGLVGINGAGKSTMMNVISGVITADTGEIIIDGNTVKINNPKDAEEHGIAIIHQELIIFNYMTVAENLFINHIDKFVKAGKLDYNALFEQTREALATVGCSVDPSLPIEEITIGQRQMVEIARALNQQAQIILFDEPTSSLTVHEKEILFDVIRRLKDEGKTIYYISHFLDEILEICDRVDVMRDGQLISDLSKDEATMERIIEDMVGQKVAVSEASFNIRQGKTVVKVEGLNGTNMVHDVNLEVCEGEILGFWGLLGSGRTEIVRAMLGLDNRISGNITFYDENGKSRILNGRGLLERCGYITENRHYDGLFLKLPVYQNFSMATLKKYVNKLHLMQPKNEKECLDEYVQKMEVKIPSQEAASEQLSGGNQQKLLIARWLNKKLRLYIFDEPTRGVDINAKSQIHQLIFDLARQGNAVIVISSEIEECMKLSSRIAIVRKGTITHSIDRAQVTDTMLMKMSMEEGII